MDANLNQKEEKAIKLYHAYLSGHEEAFAPLYDMYIDMLLNYGRCLTGNMELVQDCIHDVFVKLLDKKNAKAVKRMGSYLVISLRNRLLDEFRRTKFLVDTTPESMPNKRHVEDVEHSYMAAEHEQEMCDRAQVLLNVLTPRQRKVFQLYYIEERKYDEICRIMSMNYHSVRNLVHRGMMRMREAADSWGMANID